MGRLNVDPKEGGAMRLSEHVRAVRDYFDAAWVADPPADADDNSDWLVWLRDETRITESAAVAPLADRFVEAELEQVDPGIGRYGKHGAFHETLGARYARRISKLSGAQRDELPDLVYHPLALGYWATVDGHAGASVDGVHAAEAVRVVEDRSRADIWNFWVVRFLNDFLDLAMDKERVKRFESFGSDWFGENVRLAGLRPGGRGTVGARALGMLYVRAGMVLRIAQTNQVSDEDFGRRTVLDLSNAWPYNGDPSAPADASSSIERLSRKKRRPSGRPAPP
jgi:hypothetical protein